MQACAAKLHVESAGTGRPLVLLHGWALHAGLVAPMVASLTPRHRVHAVDLPGHGRSDPLRPWTLDAVVRSLEERFACEPEPLDVLGWSLGGMAALAWAHAHPRRIARLLLVTPTPRFVAAPDWPHGISDQTLARFADELRVAWRPTLLRFLALQVQGSEAGRATLAALRQQLCARGAPDGSVLDEALAVLRTADLRDRVGRIAQPALVVTGERDTLTPAAAGAWLADVLPAGRLVTIAGAAHVPFLSHRDAFMRAAIAFLDG